MKLISTLSLIVITCSAALSCPVCDRQQPSITRGITHGAGPSGNWDWVIVSVITLITLLTLFLSLKFLIRPGEKNHDHIKHVVLNNQL